MLCRPLLSFSTFFFWPLCCLFFFDIRILITPLVSSNSSQRPGKAQMDPVQVHNRCGYLEIFPRMIHIAFWMSRHQKHGDHGADLQMEGGTKGPKGSNVFTRSFSNNVSHHQMKLSRT